MGDWPCAGLLSYMQNSRKRKEKMETYKLKIFGREQEYESNELGLFYLGEDQRTCITLKEKILEPTVLCYDDFPPIHFYVRDDHFIEFSMIGEIEKLAMQIMHRQPIQNAVYPDIQDAILECSTDLTHVVRNNLYRDIRLNPCITDPITKMLDRYIADISKLRTEIAEKIEIEKQEREKRKKRWREIRRYSFVRPSGGENGENGYLDADYESQDGVIVRMVSRDVFDFGCYAYPKIVEGTDNVFSWENWTKPERDLMSWLSEFGPFSGIRM